MLSISWKRHPRILGDREIRIGPSSKAWFAVWWCHVHGWHNARLPFGRYR